MAEALTNGFITYYEIEGEGHPLVLIHGHTANLHLWDDQVPVLSRSFRVVRYDVRGHGRSQAPPSGYSWANYAEDLRQLLVHLNINRAHLVGLSMGGAIALQFALDHPQMASALVLADSTLEGFPFSDEFAEPWERMIALAQTEGVQKALTKVWLNHPLFDGIKRFPTKWRRLQKMALSFSGAEYLNPSQHQAPQRPQMERLSEIRAPTLVLVGEKDIEDFRLIADVLEGGIPGAQKLTIPDSGHVVNMEAPEAFNSSLTSFLNGLP